VLPPWAVPPLGSEAVLVEAVLGADLDAAGLEQAASGGERAATVAETPDAQGRLERVFDHMHRG
jgi:hypothetical protein